MLNHKQQTQKFQTASNQVIAAYGDPRDLRFSANRHGDGQGQTSLSRDYSKEEGPHRDIESESGDVSSENKDTVSNHTRDHSKNPRIPKLNLI